MSAKSTTIGRAYEKEIAIQLSNWINRSYPENNRLLHFAITEGSGSRATTLKNSGSLGYEDDSSVDLRPVTDLGRQFCSIFCIECKCYESFDLDQSILKEGNVGASSILFTHWDKIEETASYHNRHPILFYKNKKLKLKQFNSTLFVSNAIYSVFEKQLEGIWTSIIRTPLVFSFNTSSFFNNISFKEFIDAKNKLIISTS